jgi:hypothetical protein
LLESRVLLEIAAASCRKQIGLVGAVGIELRAMLKACKLLISLKERNGKSIKVAEAKYAPGTRRSGRGGLRKALP